jgi:hypothetical protein
VKEDGAKVKISLTKADDTLQVQVGEVEITACTELTPAPETTTVTKPPTGKSPTATSPEVPSTAATVTTEECAYGTMVTSTEFVLSEVSSNENLENYPSEEWESAPSDATPFMIFVVSEDVGTIEDVTLPDTSNVDSVTIEVLDKNDTPVGDPIEGKPGDTISVKEDGAKVKISLTKADDTLQVQVGEVEITACTELTPSPETTKVTKPATSKAPTVTSPAVCALTLATYQQFIGQPPQDDQPVAYIEMDGVKGYSDGDSKVYIDDELEDGVVATLIKECVECSCQDGLVDCAEKDTCTRDCAVEEWSEWGVCSSTCGGGVSERTRNYILGTPDGKPCGCEHALKEKQYCNIEPCIVDGNWNAWGTWEDCSVTCGGSVQRRFRECNDPKPSNGGKPCVGEDFEVKECNTLKCPGADDCPSNKVWTGQCDGPISCFDYSQSETYSEPDGCNQGCRCGTGMVDDGSGNCVQPTEQCGCYNPKTKETLYEGQSKTSVDGCQKFTCESAVLTITELECNRDCGYTPWSDWGECTSLTGGKMLRFRGPNCPEKAGNGKDCDDSLLQEEAECGSEECNTCVIDDVTYAVGQVISVEICQERCFCNEDGEKQCQSLEKECVDCAEGFELSPTAEDCCRCTPTKKECQLKETVEVLEFQDENGVTCKSLDQVPLTSCQGSCASFDTALVTFENGNVSHEKVCKCCAGVDFRQEEQVQVSCDGNERTVTVRNFNRCQCDICQGGEVLPAENP